MGVLRNHVEIVNGSIMVADYGARLPEFDCQRDVTMVHSLSITAAEITAKYASEE